MSVTEPWHIRYTVGDAIPAATLAFEREDDVPTQAEWDALIKKVDNISLAIFNGGTSCGTKVPDSRSATGEMSNAIIAKLDAISVDAKEASAQANLNGAELTNMDGKLSALVAAEATEGDGSAHTHAIDLVLSADLTGRAVGSTGPAQPLDV